MLNSTITLDQIVVASKASGISIADLVLAIDSARTTPVVTPATIAPEAGIYADPSIAATSAPVRKASKPASKPAKKATKPAKAKPVTVKPTVPMREVAVTDGKGVPTGKVRMMPSTAGTITKNQKANIIGFCDRNDFFYPENMDNMSVATASEQYSMLKAAK